MTRIIIERADRICCFVMGNEATKQAKEDEKPLATRPNPPSDAVRPCCARTNKTITAANTSTFIHSLSNELGVNMHNEIG